jgi:hypothetical protein
MGESGAIAPALRTGLPTFWTVGTKFAWDHHIKADT